MEGEEMGKSSPSKGLVKRIVGMVKILSKDSQGDQLSAQEEEVSTMSLSEVSQDEEGEPQGGEVSVTLPEELVERILAMVPFPYLFKAKALSKSWLARFSPVESQADEVKKQRAISFQKLVGEWSSNWKTLFPVFIERVMIDQCDRREFIAFDRASHSWPRMPSISFLPSIFLLSSSRQIDGALLLYSGIYFHLWEKRTARRKTSKLHLANFLTRCLKCLPARVDHGIGNETLCREHKLYVANLLTRRWKELPCPPPEGENFCLFEKLVSNPLLGTYKVILFNHLRVPGGSDFYLVHIYDSKSNDWRRKTCVNERTYRCHSPAYLDGVLYLPLGENPRNILCFDVEKETFTELEMLGDVMGRVVDGLVVCNDKLFMIVTESRFAKPVHVLRIDLGLLTLFEVARGPPAVLNAEMLNTPYGSDGVCICFPTVQNEGMVVYNVLEDEWSYVPFPASVDNASLVRTCFSFQPNLNPFMAV